ncbi:MAG TPA: ribonuclease HI [Alphaproteobacteria bacterium]|nr:ribonuclease HI [Alphaproteobacteria bacterium]
MDKQTDKQKVDLFTDGACSGNPGPGGWAYLLRWNGTEREGSGGENPTTNNRMEMQAVVEGLNALKQGCAVTIHTDSQYVMKGMTEWMPGWLKRNWKNSQNKVVENRDLWELLRVAAARHDLTWVWVRGHAGHPENERVDRLAVAAISKLAMPK